jgi:hypothetical protein
MEEKGWSLDFIYLDQGENRFELQKQGECFVQEAKDMAQN